MYGKILFAIDDDAALPGAVPVVAAYARRWGARVHVLHVHRLDGESSGLADRELVRDVTGDLEACGVRATGEVRLAARGERVGAVIARVAGEEATDLVVVGSHGRSDLAALFRGSVGHEVAAGLDVPVLVLRGLRTAAPATVVVGVDGSRASDQAVAEAGDVATVFGARVLAVHAQVVTATDGWAAIEPDRDAHAIVRNAVAALEARGVPVTGECTVTPSVVDCLARAAETAGADLVVLGSRRPSDLAGLLLGSTAHALIHRLRCPVLLAGRVREEAPA